MRGGQAALTVLESESSPVMRWPGFELAKLGLMISVIF